MSEQRTITLDGATYDVATFSEGVQQAVGIYNTFASQLQVEQLAVLKTRSAMEGLSNQIAGAVRKELEDKSAAEKAAAPAAEADPAA
jgi:hypothetical protein